MYFWFVLYVCFLFKKTSDLLITSFLMSDVSESLKSLTKNEWCEQIAQIAHQKWATMSKLLRSLTKNEWIARFFEGITDLLIFSQNPAIPSENQWENSQPCDLLIFGERPEQITHGHSFLVSNLSNLLISLIITQ